MASVAHSVELKSAEYLTELPTPTAVRLWPTCLDAGPAVVNKQQGKNRGKKEEGIFFFSHFRVSHSPVVLLMLPVYIVTCWDRRGKI